VGFLVVILLLIPLYLVITGTFENYKYGYKEIYLFPASKLLSVFNDSVRKDISIEVSAKNGFNDSAVIFTYKKSFKILFWKLYQYKHLSLKDFIEVPSKSLKNQDFQGYSLFGSTKDQYLVVRQKDNNSTPDKVYFTFNDHQRKIYKKACDNGVLYMTDCQSVEFFTVKDYREISISKLNNRYASFMILRYQDVICILFAVSLRDKDLDTDDLIPLINIEKFSFNGCQQLQM